MVVAILLMILAPIVAQLIYFAVSRKREYLADASAAAFTRYPDGLARALEKISGAHAGNLKGASRATAPMYIVNPMAAANEKANLGRVRTTLTEYAREYPIEGWSFNRQPVLAHLEAFERARSVAGFAVAGKLATDMSDISARLGLLAALLPRQAAWEAELLAEGYVTRDDVDRALADLTDIPESVDRLRLFAEESADLVLNEKDALLAELEAEDGPLGKVMGEAEAFITRERVAVIAELKSERAVVMEALQADIDELVETLQAERAVVLDEVRALSGDTVGSLALQIEGAIDHFFLRLVQLLAVLVVVGFVGGYVLVRAARKQPA